MKPLLLAAPLALVLTGCATSPLPEPVPSYLSEVHAPATPAAPAPAEAAVAAATPAPPEAHAPAADDDLYVIDPAAFATLPEGPEGARIRRGHELVMDTHRLLPDHVGNGLNCTNCHLGGGTTPKAAPYVGVDTRYPRYRKRSGKVDDLSDRINGCMERSMNGEKLEKDSEPMLAMVAYMEWLSRDVEDGNKVADIGMPRIQPPSEPDPERGKVLFQNKCSACHGMEGQGIFGQGDQTMFPPLWGPRSYNVGAGMARLNTAAAFVKWNMPLGQGGSLSDQEAYDIASYFIFNERPDLAGKASDWPKGGKPEDARY